MWWLCVLQNMPMGYWFVSPDLFKTKLNFLCSCTFVVYEQNNENKNRNEDKWVKFKVFCDGSCICLSSVCQSVQRSSTVKINTSQLFDGQCWNVFADIHGAQRMNLNDCDLRKFFVFSAFFYFFVLCFLFLCFVQLYLILVLWCDI